MPNESISPISPVLVGAGVPASPLKRTLSSQLARLAARFAHRPVRLGELTDVLQLRGSNALLLFLAFPFVTPVPLPVPFSNAFPAFTLILLAAAGLERDGAVFLAGCVQFLLCLGFFCGLCFGGAEAWQRLFN